MSIIYTKTASGQAVMQNRSVGLSPRQRSAFILFDGKRTDDEILGMTAGIGVTQADVDYLVDQGLLEISGTALSRRGPASVAASLSAAPTAPIAPLARSTQSGAPGQEDSRAIYLKAYPIATRLASELGFRGLPLNLAVEAAGDLTELRELAPRIRKAVGAEKFKELEDALR